MTHWLEHGYRNSVILIGVALLFGLLNQWSPVGLGFGFDWEFKSSDRKFIEAFLPVALMAVLLAIVTFVESLSIFPTEKERKLLREETEVCFISSDNQKGELIYEIRKDLPQEQRMELAASAIQRAEPTLKECDIVYVDGTGSILDNHKNVIWTFRFQDTRYGTMIIFSRST